MRQVIKVEPWPLWGAASPEVVLKIVVVGVHRPILHVDGPRLMDR